MIAHVSDEEEALERSGEKRRKYHRHHYHQHEGHCEEAALAGGYITRPKEKLKEEVKATKMRRKEEKQRAKMESKMDKLGAKLAATSVSSPKAMEGEKKQKGHGK